MVKSLMMKGVVAIALSIIPFACNASDTAEVAPEPSQAPAETSPETDVPPEINEVEPNEVAEATPAPPEVDQAALELSGIFVTADAGHPTEGSITVFEENNQIYLDLASNFKTVRGPDVNVLLHKAETVPVAIDEADYVSIAPLESFSGEQRYLIPADINLEDFKSVAVWCARFNVTFGYATLQ
ncbi:MAG: DM13 domain-containing protein [Leptolyngbya sp. SIO3F4]|nr:DM13 domain-containing protein [Leptolyngbya sp. SIO3F4]